MIANWAFAIVSILAAIGVVIYINYYFGKRERAKKLWLSLLCIALGITFAGWSLWSLYGTEAGRRSIKTFQSNTMGGIDRTVRVYDINGQLIDEYHGRFDVDYDSVRIIFDDENGKRHTIFFTTGTVFIDEV